MLHTCLETAANLLLVPAQVQEATEVFRRYCLRQAVLRGTLPPRNLSVLRDPGAAAAAAAGLASAGFSGGSTEHPARPPSSQSTAPSVATTSRPFSATAAAQLAGAAMSYQSFCAALVHVAAKLARGSQEALEACPFLSVRCGYGGLEAGGEESRRGCLHGQLAVSCIDAPPMPATSARRALQVPRILCHSSSTAHSFLLPDLQEQARAFVESIAPKAQRVSPIIITTKKGGASSSSAGPKSPGAGPGGSLGAKDAAAKEAAAKLPKLKKSRGADSGAPAGGNGGSAGGKVQGNGSDSGRAQGEMSAIAEASREGSRIS